MLIAGVFGVTLILSGCFFRNDPNEPDLSTIQTQVLATSKASLATPTSTENVDPVPTHTDVPQPPTVIPTTLPSSNPSLIKPGTYLVGPEIRPGLYTGSAGEELSGSCYWARISNPTGSLSNILANDRSVGKFYIEVGNRDYALQTDCELTYLSSLPAPPVEFPKRIMAGTYLVGVDIQPGIYQGEAGDTLLEMCYWARLSNVTGESNGLIENDNVIEQYYVQVQPDDFALETTCELERISE